MIHILPERYISMTSTLQHKTLLFKAIAIDIYILKKEWLREKERQRKRKTKVIQCILGSISV